MKNSETNVPTCVLKIFVSEISKFSIKIANASLQTMVPVILARKTLYKVKHW